MIEARVPSASDGRRVAPWWSRGHDRRPAPSRSCEDGSPRHRFIPRSGTQRDPRRRSPLRPAPPSSPQKHGARHRPRKNERVHGQRPSRGRATLARSGHGRYDDLAPAGAHLVVPLRVHGAQQRCAKQPGAPTFPCMYQDAEDASPAPSPPAWIARLTSQRYASEHSWEGHYLCTRSLYGTSRAH